jgi:hypothetical protein
VLDQVVMLSLALVAEEETCAYQAARVAAVVLSALLLVLLPMLVVRVDLFRSAVVLVSRVVHWC